MPIEEKKRRADLVIDNSGTEGQTRAQVEQVLDDIRARAKPGGRQHIA
jgi:dephospho-CoA kinase